MKGKNLILMALIAVVIGVGLILVNSSLHASGIVLTAGAIFILAGVLNMLVFLGERDSRGRTRQSVLSITFGWVASAASIVLGLAMLLFQGTFLGLVSFMMAVLIVVAALFQFFLLVYGSRPTHLSGWFYLVPMVLIGIAVYVFLLESGVRDREMLLATGIAFTIFGAATFVEGSIIGNNNRRNLRDKHTSAPDSTAKPLEQPEKADETTSENSQKA